MNERRPYIKKRFSTVYTEWDGRIRQGSRHAHIIGMTSDEVRGAMIVTLWQAWKSHDPRTSTPFAAYFWTLWHNERIVLYRKLAAQKRGPYPELVDEWHEAALVRHGYIHIDEPPCVCLPVVGIDPDEERMWDMLAVGYNQNEVRHELHISWRRWYRLTEAWRRHPEVRAALGMAASQGRTIRFARLDTDRD